VASGLGGARQCLVNLPAVRVAEESEKLMKFDSLLPSLPSTRLTVLSARGPSIEVGSCSLSSSIPSSSSFSAPFLDGGKKQTNERNPSCPCKTNENVRCSSNNEGGVKRKGRKGLYTKTAQTDYYSPFSPHPHTPLGPVNRNGRTEV
jgi:hypothetical protein